MQNPTKQLVVSMQSQLSPLHFYQSSVVLKQTALPGVKEMEINIFNISFRCISLKPQKQFRAPVRGCQALSVTDDFSDRTKQFANPTQQLMVDLVGRVARMCQPCIQQRASFELEACQHLHWEACCSGFITKLT